MVTLVVFWLRRLPHAGSGDPEAGASIVEYALLLSLIVLAAFAAVVFIGGSVSNGLTTSGNSLFNSP